MILADKKLIPNEILKDSVLVHLADAYFHITRRMEQRKRTASEGSPYKAGKDKDISQQPSTCADQNRSCSVKWSAKQEKFPLMEECFFLTSTFIEQIRPRVGISGQVRRK